MRLPHNVPIIRVMGVFDSWGDHINKVKSSEHDTIFSPSTPTTARYRSKAWACNSSRAGDTDEEPTGSLSTAAAEDDEEDEEDEEELPRILPILMEILSPSWKGPVRRT